MNSAYIAIEYTLKCSYNMWNSVLKYCICIDLNGNRGSVLEGYQKQI